MASLIDRNELRAQVEAITMIEPETSFFERTFFGGPETFYDVEKVEWDEVFEGFGMADYVHPRAYAVPTEREPFDTREIMFPKLGAARTITTDDLQRRMPGQTMFDVVSAEQQAARLRAADYDFCMKAVDRKREWQCAQFILNGRYDIDGTGIKAQIDYELPLRMSLTGGARWGQPGVNPLNTLKEMYEEMLKYGNVADDLIISHDVFMLLLEDETFKRWLGMDSYRADMMYVAPEKVSKYGEATFVGQTHYPWLNIYVYDGMYKTKDNRWVRYMDKGQIIMVTPKGRQNKQIYGPIIVKGEDWTSWETFKGRYIPLVYHEDRPPSEIIEVYSRPVPIPADYFSWYTATVV